MGNILNKAGTAYDYTHNGQLYGHPSGAGGPYAVRNAGYSYDANGNMTAQPAMGTSPSRTLTWSYENQPTQITSGTTTEQYVYDADNERVKRTVTGTGISTYYMGGLYEEDVPPAGQGQATQRYMYTLNGQVIAQREVAPDPCKQCHLRVSICILFNDLWWAVLGLCHHAQFWHYHLD